MAKNRIAMLRKEQGLNQKELGEKLGMGQTTVSAWETGKNEPDNEALNKMAQLFHVSVGYLLGFEAETLTRGLSTEQMKKLVQEMDKEQQEKWIEEQIKRQEREEAGEPSEEEIAEWEKDKSVLDWKHSNLKEEFFEVYQFSQMCEYMTQEERERALKVMQLTFPSASKGKYTDNSDI